MNIPENFDRWMFDYVEGNLSPLEKESFERFLAQNPDFEPEADAWENAFIQDENVIYPNQNQLEKKRKLAGWYGWSAAAVAVLLLGIGGLQLMNNTTEISSDQSGKLVAHTTNQMHTRDENRVLNTLNLVAPPATNTANHTTNTTTFSFIGALAAGQAEIENEANENSDFVQEGNQINEGDYTTVEGSGAIQNLMDALTTTKRAPGAYTSLQQAESKLKDDEYASKYLNNPLEKKFDANLIRKNRVDYNSFSNRTKRVYRKVEKMLDYPVGLINLRDPELIVPENNLLAFNPAFAGGMLKSRFELNYRNQWLGTDMEVQRFNFGFDNYIEQIKGGVGVMTSVQTYGNGAFSDYSADLFYSPKISLSKNIIFEPAVKVTLGMLAVNTNKFDSSSDFETERGLAISTGPLSSVAPKDKLWYKDYGLGFMLNTKWFYAGFSADNLANHYSNVYATEGPEPVRTPTLLTGIAGVDWESVNKNMSLSPFVSYRQYGQNNELWAGVSYRHNHFIIGGSYSSNGDYAASIGMKFKHFKMMYHYDRTQPLLTGNQVASHNIGIRFNGKVKNAQFKY